MESTISAHFANISDDDFSGNESILMLEMIRRYQENRSVDEPFYSIIIIMYSFLIIFGSCGNILVVLAVARNKSMQTARNIFIVNLAISDLLLCIVTSPLTLIEVLSKYWPFGNTEQLCKSMGMLQGISIYVSTISITAIALDRYHVIVGCPAKDNLQMFGAILILSFIWLIAFLCAFPLYVYKTFKPYAINMKKLNIHTIYYCYEDWPNLNGRVYYSIFALTLQYLIPILIVSCAYQRIYSRLKSRIVVTQNVNTVNRLQERRGRRTKRTNFLLFSIALIFGISWLPINIYNLSTDLYFSMNDVNYTPIMYIIYAVCHMAGMSSACSNPLLYGWLNSNFKKEFNEILCCKKSVKNKRKDSADVEQNGDAKQKTELLKPNGNHEEMQEYTLTTNI